MVSAFYRLFSKPMGTIVNTCTSILNSLKSTTTSCIAEYLPSCEQRSLIEVNPKGIFHRTITEKPKKNLVEAKLKGSFHSTVVKEPKDHQFRQPKTTSLERLPFQQEQPYGRLGHHFQNDEVDFIYRRALKSINPTNHCTVKDEFSGAGVLVQPPSIESSNADCDLNMRELSESMILVQCPRNQSAADSNLFDSGVLVQSPPHFLRSRHFARGPISLVKALLSPL